MKNYLKPMIEVVMFQESECIMSGTGNQNTRAVVTTFGISTLDLWDLDL